MTIRIGIDCRLWNETGVGRYTRNLVSELSKIDSKNSYVLFALNKDVSSIKYHVLSIKHGNWKIVVADIRWHTIEEQIKFPQILNKEKLDLVHFPYFSVPIFYKRPFVVTIHDLILNHYPTGQASTLPFPIYKLKLLGYKFVIAQVAKKAEKIITVSNTTKEEIIDHLGVSPQKVVVTYEGVDDKIRNSKSQLPSNSQLSTLNSQLSKYFLYVGNAYPHKNLERLINAFEIINSQFSTLNLVLVGKEDYFYKRLKEKIQKMKLLYKVIFLQNVNDEELASLYKNAIALVMPSLMEGFGLPALEAMANKCLVLASDIPSLKETCGDAALYFNPLSIDELAEKLNMVTLHTTEYGGLEELRRRGLERAKMFSWKKMAKETLGVYEMSIP